MRERAREEMSIAYAILMAQLSGGSNLRGLVAGTEVEAIRHPGDYDLDT
jgi:hypothetical protein